LVVPTVQITRKYDPEPAEETDGHVRLVPADPGSSVP
jgi:hypothetical protein